MGKEINTRQGATNEKCIEKINGTYKVGSKNNRFEKGKVFRVEKKMKKVISYRLMGSGVPGRRALDRRTDIKNKLLTSTRRFEDLFYRI